MKKLLFFSILSLIYLSVPAQVWNQIGDDIPGEGIDDRCGFSVSMSDDGLTMAVGSPFYNEIAPNVGQVRIFTYDGVSWVLKGNPIEGITTEIGFGISVSLSADANRVAVCASYGKVRVYEWDVSSWQQIGNSLDKESLSIATGQVTLSGNGEVLGVGDLENTTNGTNAGQVRLYTLNGDTWQQKGSTISGSTNGYTGITLSLSNDGNTFATNLLKDIQVYYWNSTDWSFKGSAMNEFPAEKVSLSSDANTMAISGLNEIGQTDGKGIAQVYQWNGSSWNQKGNAVEGNVPQSYFGYSLSLSKNGQVMAIGTPYGNVFIGEVKVFVQNGTNWEQTGNTIFGESNSDYLGHAISLNAIGNIIGVGIPTYIYYSDHGLWAKTKVFRNEGISDVKKINRLEIGIYPNPSSGNFTIDLGKEYSGVTIEISNTVGQIISSEKYASAKTIKQEITTSAGIYFVKVRTANEGSTTLRVIKQ